MPPKKKPGRQEAASGAAAAAATGGSGASGAPTPSTAQAAKQAAKLFASFNKKRDVKLLSELAAAAEAAPCAATHLMLAKAHTLHATDVALKRGQMLLYPTPGRTAGPAEVAQRYAAEEQLEADVVTLLMVAFEAACQGVLQPSPRKERSLRCLMLASLLGAMMRGRGGEGALSVRRGRLQELAKFVELAHKLPHLVLWVPASDEALLRAWPFEEVNGRPIGDQVPAALKNAIKLLAESDADDAAAQQASSRGAPAPDPTQLLLQYPEEARRRVQERLSSWPVLPEEARIDIARRYNHILRREGVAELARAAGGGGGGGSGGGQVKLGKAQADKQSRADERQVERAVTLSKIEDKRRRQAEQEQAEQQQLRAAAAVRQQKRAAAAAELLLMRVKEAGGSKDAQLAALLSCLRMSTGDMRQGVKALVRDKEWTEAQGAALLAALTLLPSSQQQHLYCWLPEAAAACASPAAGGPGTPGAGGGAGGRLLASTDHEQFRQQLLSSLECGTEGMRALVEEQIALLPGLGTLVKEFGALTITLDIDAFTASNAALPPLELQPAAAPLEEDLKLLELAADGRHFAAVYESHGDDLHTKCHLLPLETEAAGEAAAAAPGEAMGDVAQHATAAPAEEQQQEQQEAEQQQQQEGQEEAAGQVAVGGAAPHPREVQYALCPPLADYIMQTWGQAVGLVESVMALKLGGSVAQDDGVVPTYGFAADFLGLAGSMLRGQQMLVLVEAAEKGGQPPASWQWWHYRLLTPNPSNDPGSLGALLAAFQPDKAEAVAAAADSFMSWLRQKDAEMSAYLESGHTPQQQQQEQAAPADDSSGSVASPAGSNDGALVAAAAPADAAKGTEAAAADAAGAAGEGAALVAAAGSAEAAAGPAAAAAAAAGGVDPEDLPEQPSGLMNQVVVDWMLWGLAAISMAASDMPAAAAAAAAAAEGGSPDDAGAAWLVQEKLRVSRRIQSALMHQQDKGLLTIPMLQHVIDFVLEQQQQQQAEQQQGEQEQQQGQEEGVTDTAVADTGAGVGAGEAAEAAAAASPEQQQRRQEGEGEEEEEEQGLSVAELLGALPRLPLSSLHYLLAFLCMLLPWRHGSVHSVVGEAWDVDALMAACLDINPPPADAAPADPAPAPAAAAAAANAANGAGVQQVALTAAGLDWALVSLGAPPAGDGTPPPAIDPAQLAAGKVSVADMAAHLASLGCPTQPRPAAAAAAAADAGPEGAVAAAAAAPVAHQQQEQEQQGGGSASSVGAAAALQPGPPGGASQKPCPAGAGATDAAAAAAVAGPRSEAASGVDAGTDAGRGTGGAACGPPRLLPAVASWRAPATMAERLTAHLASRSSTASSSASSSGSALAMKVERAQALVTAARLAAYYMHLLEAAHCANTRVLVDLNAAAVDMAVLEQWLDKYNPAMHLPPPCSRDVVRLALRRICAAVRCTSVNNVIHLTFSRLRHEQQLPSIRSQLASRQQQLAAAEAAAAAAEDGGSSSDQAELRRLQAQVAAAQYNLDTWSQQLEQFAAELAGEQQLLLDEDRPGAHGDTVQQTITACRQVELLLVHLEASMWGEPPAARTQRRRHAASELREPTLGALQMLQDTALGLHQQVDADLPLATHLAESFYHMAHLMLSSLVSEVCLVHVWQQAASDMLQHLLPLQWEAQLSGAKAVVEAKRLMDEEEREEAVRRQAETERREAERKAKAKRAKKAAGGGASGGGGGGVGKGAGRADWREQLEDVQGGGGGGDREDDLAGAADEEEDGLRPEQAAGYHRSLEGAGGHSGGGGAHGDEEEEEEWLPAGASRQHRPPTHSSGSQQQQGQGAAAVVAVTAPRPRPLPHTLPRQQPASKPAPGAAGAGGSSWDFSDDSLPAVGEGWSFGDTWGQQQAAAAAAAIPAAAAAAAPAAAAGSWAQRARAQGGAAGEGDTAPEQPAAAEDEEEDADFQAAVAASLASAGATSAAGAISAAGSGGATSAAAGATSAASPAGPGQDLASLLQLSGLRNQAGEYNCFLNVIVQCLWHCEEFRQQVAQWEASFAAADPVVGALHALFLAFQHQQEEEQEAEQAAAAAAAAAAEASATVSTGGGGEGGRQDRSAPLSPARPIKAVAGTAAGGGGGSPARLPLPRPPGSPAPSWAAAAAAAAVPADGAGGSNGAAPPAARVAAASRQRSAVDPGPLREALSGLQGYNFNLGEMSDAAEVLLCIYERVMEAAAARGRPAGIDATFGLAVQEEVHCHACGKTTHQSSYMQYFYNTQATMLRMLHEGGATTGGVLRQAEQQHLKSCDTDMAGCGAPNIVNHFLGRPPRVFTLQLSWESHHEQPGDIAATLAAIDEEVDLGEVYQGVDAGVHRYRLRSMVCYYGQHYQALVLVPDAGGWLMFDDMRVSRVGAWADVRRKCEAGRIQPYVLFYEAI